MIDVRRNPFATRFIRAGAIPFRFPPHQNVDVFFEKLKTSQWRGQIVGNHGSGKSTLLRSLDPHWTSNDRCPEYVSLRNRQRWLPKLNWQTFDAKTQIIVDGYEQLCTPARLWLHARCRMRRCGLLITTHHHVAWLPVIQQHTTSLALAIELTRDLVHKQDGTSDVSSTSAARRIVSDLMIERHFRTSRGNVREMFLSLYDEVQADDGAGRREGKSTA